MEAKERWQEVMAAMATAPLTLSPKISATIRNSTLGLLMILARYKFVVKMLQNRTKLRVLDLGCNDGLGDLMIHQNCDCEKIIGVDFDTAAIRWGQKNITDDVLKLVEDDFLGKEFCPGGGDCVVSLDVIEHIEKDRETCYLDTICKNLRDDGIAIIGTPNEKMIPYASPFNRIAHVNNYDQERLYKVLSNRFENVFIFGMTDEVLHTGFYPMTCYIMALCCHKKKNIKIKSR